MKPGVVMTLIGLVALLGITDCGTLRGPVGERGEQGLPGPSVPISVRPANVPGECVTGGSVVTVGISQTTICNGSNGSNGRNGANGSDGLPGAPGSPGLNATPVTLVQLCPGTTSYPGTFIEYALCIDDRLYGVYSANGGFLAYLPPGAYLSSAVGSNCTLTIHEHCEVVP